MNLQESTQVFNCHIVNVAVGIIQLGGEIRSNKQPLCMSFAITSQTYIVSVYNYTASA
jgi:hypothetical protein